MHQTAIEARAKYEAVMGVEPGAIYAELWQETVRLHRVWDEFVVLFGASEARIDLMNQAAGSFFRMVQDTFWEAVLLGVARITDPPVSVGKPNLSIRRFQMAITDPSLRPRLDTKVTAALKTSEFCRAWRNRRIAHNDLSLAVGDAGAVPLPPASRADVTTALAALADVLNEVSRSLLDSETHFSNSVVNGAESMLYVLRDGLKADDDRRDRLKAGNWTQDDMQPRPIP